MLGNPRGAIPRGLGRSYGDSANNSGGLALSSDKLNSIEIDLETGMATLGAGVSISDLEKASLIHGLFPPVVPGTARVTIGGAIASDVHGKSHHRVGSFSDHLHEIKLLSSDGSIKAVRPHDSTSPLFWATVGGMGLTGMIIEATISLARVETAFVTVKEKRVKSLNELLATLLEFNSEFMYTVAWIDLSGKFAGRGVVSGANHAINEEVSKNKSVALLSPMNPVYRKIPYPFKFGIINQAFIRMFNFLWFYKPLGKRLQNIQKYMHPLDSIENWNVVYGKGGFIQYQFVIPFDRSEVLNEVLLKLKKSNHGSFLSVLKSFGKDTNSMLGFAMKGWSLAIDFPKNSKNLSSLLGELDQLVLGAGGRIYLTKDSRVDHRYMNSMYPKLKEWKCIKIEIDPDNLWQSDQGRRLKLC